MSVGVRQHTQDVRGCPCLSVSTHMTSVAVRVCPCVSVSTHMTSVAIHLYTYQHADTGRLWVFAAHKGRPWVSVSTHMTSLAVRVCPCVSVSTHRTFVAVHQYTYQHVGPWTQHADLPKDCSGDFGRRGLSVQYTQDVRGCPPAYTRRPWLSVAVRQHTQDVRGCPYVSVSTHRTSVAVRQHTQDIPHTGRPLLSISTHISTMVLGLSTLALPVDCSGDFGPRGLSVQYTQDGRVCPSAHTGRPCVSVSTHRTSVAVRQHTQNLCGCPSVHISARCTHISTLALSVNCSCTDMDMSSSFDGLDSPSKPSVLKGKRSEGMNENSFGFECSHQDAFGRGLCTCGLHFIGQSEIFGRE
ncbi:hypothetical protein YC2023_004412 [Brassica napus]